LSLDEQQVVAVLRIYSVENIRCVYKGIHVVTFIVLRTINVVETMTSLLCVTLRYTSYV